MPDEQDMFIVLMFERFDKRHEAVLYVNKIFATLGFALEVIVQDPIIGIFAMQHPAYVIGFPLQNTAIVLAQCFCDLIGHIECLGHDLCCLSCPQNGTGIYLGDGNIFETLCEGFCLLFSNLGQPKRTLAI